SVGTRTTTRATIASSTRSTTSRTDARAAPSQPSTARSPFFSDRPARRAGRASRPSARPRRRAGNSSDPVLHAVVPRAGEGGRSRGLLLASPDGGRSGCSGVRCPLRVGRSPARRVHEPLSPQRRSTARRESILGLHHTGYPERNTNRTLRRFRRAWMVYVQLLAGHDRLLVDSNARVRARRLELVHTASMVAAGGQVAGVPMVHPQI